ncbi:DUF6263 family protein [Robiginitalea sp. IMCC43444]|uniref:DUF6263 family protein n=1 Tax=Robiginitalea sp. IMCC43444 TaxID=3459121 RepID=UPI004041CD78
MYKSCLILWLLALVTPVLNGQESLRYRLDTGDVFIVQQQAEQKVVQDFEWGQQEITNRLNGILQFRVVEKNKEGYLLEFSFKKLSLHIQSNTEGDLLVVNTSQPENQDIQSKIYRSLLNHPIQMRLHPSGAILSVDGGNKLVQKLIKVAGISDESLRLQMENGLMQDYSSEALAASYEPLTHFYPTAAVRVGESWENQFRGNQPTENCWTLDSLGPVKIFISGVSKTQMQTKNQLGSTHLEGIQTTSIVCDAATGFMREMLAKGNATGYSTQTESGTSKIPTTIESKISYTLIDHKHVQ